MQYIQPVIGIGASALVFDDGLGGMFAAGAVLILGGLALAAASSRGRAEAAAEAA